jgi:hypothetical protein
METASDEKTCSAVCTWVAFAGQHEAAGAKGKLGGSQPMENGFLFHHQHKVNVAVKVNHALNHAGYDRHILARHAPSLQFKGHITHAQSFAGSHKMKLMTVMPHAMTAGREQAQED